MNLTTKKCLIAYFSRKGQNYVSGRIVDLKVGNTEVVAQMIQKKTGGDRLLQRLLIYKDALTFVPLSVLAPFKNYRR